MIHPKSEKIITIPRNRSSCFRDWTGITGSLITGHIPRCLSWVSSGHRVEMQSAGSLKHLGGMEGASSVTPFLVVESGFTLCIMSPLGNTGHYKGKIVSSPMGKNTNFLQGSTLYFLKFPHICFWFLMSKLWDNVRLYWWGHLLQPLTPKQFRLTQVAQRLAVPLHTKISSETPD